MFSSSKKRSRIFAQGDDYPTNASNKCESRLKVIFGGRLNNFYAKLQLTLWLWQQFWDCGCQQIIKWKWPGGNGLEGAAAIHNNHHTPSLISPPPHFVTRPPQIKRIMEDSQGTSTRLFSTLLLWIVGFCKISNFYLQYGIFTGRYLLLHPWDLRELYS